jgi:hypothetical protein
MLKKSGQLCIGSSEQNTLATGFTQTLDWLRVYTSRCGDRYPQSKTESLLPLYVIDKVIDCK